MRAGEFRHEKECLAEVTLTPFRPTLCSCRYIELMNNAKKSLLLVHWSFIPQGSGEGFLKALIGAVERGVQVRRGHPYVSMQG